MNNHQPDDVNDVGAESQSVSSFGGDSSPPRPVTTRRPHALPLSMQLVRPFCGVCCTECGASPQMPPIEHDEHDAMLKEYDKVFAAQCNSCVSPLVVAPMMHNPANNNTNSQVIIAEYVAACQFYGCGDRVNAGVVTCFRFSLPSLRVTGDFHDVDMLALSDVMIRHGNGALRYIQRLDFLIAAKEGKSRVIHGSKCGFRSHGAFALAKIIQACHYIQDVRLSRHKVGPYGASAIFLAASKHPSLRTLEMRHCRLLERGGMAFAELVCRSTECRLEDVNLSANHIGLRGSVAIEQELSRRSEKLPDMHVDLEANLVFQEVSSKWLQCCHLLLRC